MQGQRDATKTGTSAEMCVLKKFPFLVWFCTFGGVFNIPVSSYWTHPEMKINSQESLIWAVIWKIDGLQPEWKLKETSKWLEGFRANNWPDCGKWMSNALNSTTSIKVPFSKALNPHLRQQQQQQQSLHQWGDGGGRTGRLPRGNMCNCIKCWNTVCFLSKKPSLNKLWNKKRRMGHLLLQRPSVLRLHSICIYMTAGSHRWLNEHRWFKVVNAFTLGCTCGDCVYVLLWAQDMLSNLSAWGRL